MTEESTKRKRSKLQLLHHYWNKCKLPDDPTSLLLLSEQLFKLSIHQLFISTTAPDASDAAPAVVAAVVIVVAASVFVVFAAN